MDPDCIKILLVDNYDSFTWNIAHCLRKQPGVNLQIIEANDVDLKKVGSFDKIIFSPGPDLPREGNIMEKILLRYASEKSILGICLGLQAIWVFFGGRLARLDEPVHGRKRLIKRTGFASKVLDCIPADFEAGLYHSWIADNSHIPDCMTVTALTEEERIMAVRHRSFDIEAVQFHPESILTPLGNKMINSWLTGSDINN
jgi:anthranilate synthase component II